MAVSWFSNLFATSPFELLIEHQRKVLQCVKRVPEAIEAALEGDCDRTKQCAKNLSNLEGEADQVKARARDGLPNSILMPVSRADVLRVLSSQDSTADAAEDVGVLLSMRSLSRPPDSVVELLRQHVRAALTVVERATEVVETLDEVTQTSFSGAKAREMLSLVDEVKREEHLADKVQDQLAKEFFKHEDLFKPAEIILWIRVFERIAAIANNAKKTAQRVRLFVAT